MHAKFGLFSTRCPHCRSIDFRRGDTRNAIETTFQWLLQPYWCSLCGHRFFLFRWQIAVGSMASGQPAAEPRDSIFAPLTLGAAYKRKGTR
jgi:hypothetical protein